MQRRRNRGLELGVVLLLAEIMNVGFDQIPPVTLCTIAGQVRSTVIKIGIAAGSAGSVVLP